MLFSEIYGSYFNVVAAVLTEAVEETLTAGKLTLSCRKRRSQKAYYPFLPPCSPMHGHCWTATSTLFCGKSRRCP